MRYADDHKQKTRETVLKEAAKAIRADGPDRVAVAGIMAKAGLTHGGFYAHFASKEDLIAQAIVQMFEDGRRRFAKSTEGRSPKGALVAYIDFYLSPDHRASRSVGCPLAALSADVPRMTETSKAAFAAGVASLTGRMAERLEAAGFDAPAELANSVLSELVGALSLSRAVPDGPEAEAFLDRSRTALKQRLGLEPVE